MTKEEIEKEKLLNELSLEIKGLKKSNCNNPFNSKNLSPKVQKVLKEIETNRNHSWAVEMYERNKNNLSKNALKYRGTNITYGEMFANAYIYARSLKKLGYRKKDEIPICITNTPEFIYLLLATSFIGARPNIVGDWFAPDYLKKILNTTKSKYIFIDDISYKKIRDIIKSSNIDNVICFSITDSLGKKGNPYIKIDSLFHEFNNNLKNIKNENLNHIIDKNEFIKLGKNYDHRCVENVDLDDPFTITYTSGTVKPGYPKGVIQSNRSYITLSRFKESDVSGMPTMKNLTVLAHIPTNTHMELSCAISDTLYCNCELALEPFYSEKFFPYSILINKPNFVPASVGFWENLCKKLSFDPSFKKLKLKYLMIPTVTGEGLSIGEEKFLNQVSREHSFGSEKLPFPFSPVTFSIGGGTTESSGIFVTLFKSLQEKKLNHLIKKETLGLTPLKFADVEILDTDKNYCQKNEPGLLVANSPCEMIGYTDNELNKTTHIIDSKGKKWLKLGTYSYKDSAGRIRMKGRLGDFITLSNNKIIPFYSIEDVILKDTKNVMSCSVVNDCFNNIICHIELQPFRKKSDKHIYNGIISRLKDNFDDELINKLFIRIRDNKESFPLDPSGKRSISTLKKIGIDDKTLSFNEFININTNDNNFHNQKILKK